MHNKKPVPTRLGKPFVAGTRGSQGDDKAMNDRLAIGGDDKKSATEEIVDAVGTSING